MNQQLVPNSIGEINKAALTGMVWWLLVITSTGENRTLESEMESVVAVLVRAESVNKLENKIQT